MLSFALVVHREQGYLAECVASILDQGFADAEIVAIDDCSPDAAVLDELAERDSRVRVLRPASGIGLGEARNLAFEMAEGDYVWFVDTTDLLAAGSLAAIHELLQETKPDLLLTHHLWTDEMGVNRQGPHHQLLSSLAPEGVVTLDQRPAIADLAPHAWNKLFRRAFLRDLGVRFGRGAHSELSVSWPVLLAAERIAATPAKSYVRREPPDAARDRHAGGTAFDLFDQYDAVFAFAESSSGALAHRRRLVPSAMLRHELFNMRRMPRHERREFFRRMSESYRRHRRGDEPVSSRLPRLRERLVERGDYRISEALEGSLVMRRVLGRGRSAFARLARRVLAPARRRTLKRYYHSRLREPIDPSLAVFAAYWYRGFFCNPRAIYEKAREMVPGVRGVWVVKRGQELTMPAGVDYVVAGSREYYDLIARAGYFVNNVNFPDHLVKREGTVHVMTHHGTPLKRMGLDLGDTPGPDRIDFDALLKRCARWDYSISQNAFSTPIWERVFPTGFESLEVGYPRNDVLASVDLEDVQRVRSALGIRAGQRVVLYAPTQREYQDQYLPPLDLATVADRLGRDYVLLARVHYLYESDALPPGQGRVRDVAGYPSVEELCLAADVLITDYSSIMFDYAVLDRPIVIHAPDWEEYREMRGTYFDLMHEPPGLVTRTEEEVVEALRSEAAWADEPRRARAAFRARFCSLDDGRSAERVIRRVWLGEHEAATHVVTAGAR